MDEDFAVFEPDGRDLCVNLLQKGQGAISTVVSRTA